MNPFLLAPVLLGCGDPNDIAFGGTITWNMFPFEQGRVWEYVSTDRTLPYKLVAELEGKPDVENSINVYTVSYNERCVSNDPECEDLERFRIRWSSTRGQGVRVHTVLYSPTDIVTFEPPLVVAEPRMQLAEEVVTSTAGATFTSTYLGLVTCDTNFAGWNECGNFTIVSDQPERESPVLGTFWAAVGNGLATIEFAEDEGERWRLVDADCGTCDGDW